jgi:DNA-directed RNA polymerase subunit M/transcription elongation factor TFIIS
MESKMSLINVDKEYIDSYHFITSSSNDISITLLKEAEKINRKECVKELMKYVKEEYLAEEIEKGIFEFALVHVTIHELEHCLVENIYRNKMNDICENLDTSSEGIGNRTLLSSILRNEIKPVYIAFLAPEQLNPASWSAIIERQQRIEKISTNIGTTDLYECHRCHSRKCIIRQMQTRSADEPMTTFVTCLVCNNTFKHCN